MIIGISLFVRVGQSIFRPHKVFFHLSKWRCSVTTRMRVHSQGLGRPLRIPDEGGWEGT